MYWYYDALLTIKRGTPPTQLVIEYMAHKNNHRQNPLKLLGLK